MNPERTCGRFQKVKACRHPSSSIVPASKDFHARSAVLGWGLLGMVLFLVYSPALQGGFLWDDSAWTTDLAQVTQDWRGLWRIWSEPTVLQQYYPVTGTSFWLDRQLWGDWTLPCHVENLLLHALSAFLLWRLLRRLEIPGAALAGAVFALHPMMVESVAWITERKNVLSMVFLLGGLLAWEKAENGHAENPSDGHFSFRLSAFRFSKGHALAFLLCTAALLSKITAFVFVPAVVLMTWRRHGKLRWRQCIPPLLPMLVVTLALGLLIVWLETHHVGAQGKDFSATFAQRCLTAGRAFWFYPAKLLWPQDLCFIYPDWRAEPFQAWHWLPAVAAFLVLVGVAWSRWRGVTAAVWFYALAVFPVLGFMDTYAARYSPVWDHWGYVPSLGIIVLVSALLAKAGAHLLRHTWMMNAAAALLLSVLGFLSWRHSHDFRDMETLWRATLARNPECWLAHNNLGTLLPPHEALPHYQKSTALRPDYAQAWQNMGSAWVETGDPARALEALEKALALEPLFAEAWINSGVALLRLARPAEAIIKFQRALEIDPKAARAESGLGLALLQTGKIEEALQHAEKAVEIAPAFAEAQNNLGTVLLAAGRPDDAIRAYAEAVRLPPDVALYHFNLGNALLQQERLTEAREQFEAAVRLQPGHADARYNLGYLALREDRVAAALDHLREAVRLRPDHVSSRSSLALALMKSGAAAEAVKEYEAVLQTDPRLLSALNNLAWICATAPAAGLRDGVRALYLAQRANEVSGGSNPGVLKTLAAARAEGGQFDEALQVARQAEGIARQQGATELAVSIQECIRLFEAGQPCRDEAIR